MLQFRAVHEEYGIDEVCDLRGFCISIHDLEYLYVQVPRVLTGRQAQAIEYFLVQNITEREVAVMMGLSPTNPIAMYATSGIKNLVAMIDDGVFPRLKPERLTAPKAAA